MIAQLAMKPADTMTTMSCGSTMMSCPSWKRTRYLKSVVVAVVGKAYL